MSKKSIQPIHPKMKEFVELYRETKGFITDICRAMQITRRTYYNWLEKNEEFAIAIAEAEAEINDEMKQLLIHKAQADNDTASLIFWLKNKHPEFNNREKNQVNVQINNLIQSEKERYGI